MRFLFLKTFILLLGFYCFNAHSYYHHVFIYGGNPQIDYPRGPLRGLLSSCSSREKSDLVKNLGSQYNRLNVKVFLNCLDEVARFIEVIKKSPENSFNVMDEDRQNIMTFLNKAKDLRNELQDLEVYDRLTASVREFIEKKNQ